MEGVMSKMRCLSPFFPEQVEHGTGCHLGADHTGPHEMMLDGYLVKWAVSSVWAADDGLQGRIREIREKILSERFLLDSIISSAVSKIREDVWDVQFRLKDLEGELETMEKDIK
jgi:hypothetical protein